MPGDGEEPDQSSQINPVLTSVRDFLVANKVFSVLIIAGLLFLVTGIYLAFANNTTDEKESSVQIISDTQETETGAIIVEVSGAVKNPGVYEFENGKRVEDALQSAGGFSEDANTVWVDKMLNRAAVLQDGQKIYIPTANEQSDGSTASNLAPYQSDTSTVLSDSTQVVNINTASASELEELWGIGPVTAQNIIEQRPYSTVKELQEKGILKSNVYERNENLLTVY